MGPAYLQSIFVASFDSGPFHFWSIDIIIVLILVTLDFRFDLKIISPGRENVTHL